MTTAEVYVTAAFLVLLAVVLAWLVIYAFKMRRLEREVEEMAAADPGPGQNPDVPKVVPAGDADANADPASRSPEPVS
jgi:hypothetical protein